MSGVKVKTKSKSDHVVRRFHCSVDGKLHKVTLKRSLVNNQKIFPFTYVLFHGENDSILTNLFLDANLNIRGVESLPINEQVGNVSENFKKSKLLLKNLAEELIQVRKEYRELNRQFNDLQEEHSAVKFDFALSKLTSGDNKTEQD